MLRLLGDPSRKLADPKKQAAKEIVEGRIFDLNNKLQGRITNMTDPEAWALHEKKLEAYSQIHDLLKDEIRDAGIIGGGPGGTGAAINLGYEGGVDTVLIEKTPRLGGAAKDSSRIENVPNAEIEGIPGSEMVRRTSGKVMANGVQVRKAREARSLSYDPKTGIKTVTLSGAEEMKFEFLVLAPGMEYQKLKAPGAEYTINGNGRLMVLEGRDGEIVIVGGGNSASQAAIGAVEAVTNHGVKHVYLFARSGLGKMSWRQGKQILAHPKITVVPDSIANIVKEADGSLTVTTNGVGDTYNVKAVGTFLNGKPKTDWLPPEILEPKEIRDPDTGKTVPNPDAGKIKVDPATLEVVGMPGVYAAGDARVGSDPRIGQASGDGQKASIRINNKIWKQRVQTPSTQKTTGSGSKSSLKNLKLDTNSQPWSPDVSPGRTPESGTGAPASRAGNESSPMSQRSPEASYSPSATDLANLPTRAPQYSARFPDSESRRIAPRVPTAKKSSAPLTSYRVDLDAARADQRFFAKNTEILSKYVNLPPLKGKSTPERIAKQFVDHAVDNLLWLHDQVPEATRARSAEWYPGGNKLTARMAKQADVSHEATAGIAAALSPQKDWFQNVDLAQRVVDIVKKQADTPWTPGMTETAKRIFSGERNGRIWKNIEGRTQRDVTDPIERAAWLRVYDETFNPRTYRQVTPEGEFGEIATNMDGRPRKIAWGSLGEISHAINILNDPTPETVSANVGQNHKVRSFYNALIDPLSPEGDVVVDTHAVAGALLRPLGGTATEVAHNFGGSAKSAATGLKGTYAFYAEAYRQAAAARGIRPSAMQSIAWEAVRGLFRPEWKRNKTHIANVNKMWESYKNGKATLDETRQRILEYAEGVDAPEWERGPNRGVAPEERDPSDTGDVSGSGLPGRSAGGREPGPGTPRGTAEPGRDTGSEETLRAAPVAHSPRQEPERVGVSTAPLRTQDITSFRTGRQEFDSEYYRAFEESNQSILRASGARPIAVMRVFGGWQDTESGNVSREVSQRILVPSEADAPLIASLSAVLAPEIQNGAMIATYRTDATGREYRLKLGGDKEADQIVERLNDYGLGAGFTYDPVGNTLHLAVDNTNQIEKIRDLIQYGTQEKLIEVATYETVDLDFPDPEAFRRVLTGARQKDGGARGEEYNPGETRSDLDHLVEKALARLDSEGLGRPSQAAPAQRPPADRVIETDTGQILVPPGVQYSPAFHGTPHEVDQFKLEKIGTGEGAQAYGWGLYFAENPEVAASYRDAGAAGAIRTTADKINGVFIDGKPLDAISDIRALSRNVGANSHFVVRAEDIADRQRPGESFLAAAQRYIDSKAPTTIDKRSILKGAKLLDGRITRNEHGNTYTVDVRAEAHELLDWDKPLRDQPKEVKAALEPFLADLGPLRFQIEKKSGSEFYDQLGTKLAEARHGSRESAIFARHTTGEGDLRKRAASEALAKAGLKGIKYLDQGSRDLKWQVTYNDGRTPARFQNKEEATRFIYDAGDAATGIEPIPQTLNFVIFDDRDIKITHRNGEPVTHETAQTAAEHSPRIPFGEFDTVLSPGREAQFQQWISQQPIPPEDDGRDYDYRGAFVAGIRPDGRGHWPDTFKKPAHPTFSVESKYSRGRSAGRWEGEKFIPPKRRKLSELSLTR